MRLATGLVVALFPFAAVGGDCSPARPPAGHSSVRSHAAAGMSRHDLKELDEHLDAGST